MADFKNLGLTNKQIKKLEQLSEIRDMYVDKYNQTILNEFSDIKNFDFNKVSLPSVSPEAIKNYANINNGNINELINRLDKILGTTIYNLELYGHSTGYVDQIRRIADSLNLPFDYLINLSKDEILQILREDYYHRTGVYITSYDFDDYVEE